MANTGDARYCTRFKIKGPNNGAAQLNPGAASGVFIANAYPVPSYAYPTGTWVNNIVDPPTITGGITNGGFSLNNFGQHPSGPQVGKWYWQYDCTEQWIYSLIITYAQTLNTAGVYEDEYIIEINAGNATQNGNNRGYMTLLTMGDGSLFCTVFPVAIIQQTNSITCPECLP
jgi:hypothetical protein